MQSTWHTVGVQATAAHYPPQNHDELAPDGLQKDVDFYEDSGYCLEYFLNWVSNRNHSPWPCGGNKHADFIRLIWPPTHLLLKPKGIFFNLSRTTVPPPLKWKQGCISITGLWGSNETISVHETAIYRGPVPWEGPLFRPVLLTSLNSSTVACMSRLWFMKMKGQASCFGGSGCGPHYQRWRQISWDCQEGQAQGGRHLWASCKGPSKAEEIRQWK